MRVDSIAVAVICVLAISWSGLSPVRAKDKQENPPPLYTYADSATLKQERERLLQERDALREERKALKKAKKQTEDKAKKEHLQQRIDEIDRQLNDNWQLRRETRNFLITPFVAPTYTPEMKFLISAGALMSFKTHRRDPKLQRSSMHVTGGYSNIHASMIFERLTSFWASDWLRFDQELFFKNMPDNYWGVGYEKGREHPKPNSHTHYHRTWWDVAGEFGIKLGIKGLYAGPRFDINQTIAKDVNDTMAADPYYQEFGSNNYNGGLGAAIRYDTRDVAVNAFSGLYFALKGTFYGPYMGSDNTYQVYDFDYRHYLTIGRPGNTLAWRIYTRASFGNVPYAELSMIGNPNDLRGYTWGRYRHKTIVLGLLEYRIQFKRIWPSPKQTVLGPHGMVAWIGTGSLGETYADMHNWLPNFGAGYRFELQPRMNFRLDMGIGSDTFAVYFNFMESF